MKNIITITSFILVLATLLNPVEVFSQKETFDIATYSPPKTWKKQKNANAVQFVKENTATGAYCIITLLKAVPGTTDSKSDFDTAWETVVKGMVTVSEPPAMEPVDTGSGWEVQSGYSTFEQDSSKGIVLLVTSSGFQEMINVIIMTNTDVYEKNIADFLGSIRLKKPAGAAQPVKKESLVQTKKEPAKPAVANGYTFTTTNFDDGWTSTVQEDWVLVTKATTRVLIHYPNKIVDEYNPDLLQGLKNAWNILVAPKYSAMSTVEFKPVYSWEPIEWAEADAVDNSTARPVHIVFFKKNYSDGRGKYLEFITPDKNSFVQEFGVNDGSSSDFSKEEKMINYNKFAVAAADLKGKWTSNFSGAIQYVNAFSGASAGMDTHASSEHYNLGPGDTYQWDLGVASGFVGNIKFQGVKSAGRFSMIGNWQVHFSDIEKKPRTYDVSFSCIKGLRVLWIDGKAFAKVE